MTYDMNKHFSCLKNYNFVLICLGIDDFLLNSKNKSFLVKDIFQTEPSNVIVKDDKKELFR
jgi:hypothetical protein